MTALHVAPRLVAAVPFWARIAMLVEALWEAAALSLSFVAAKTLTSLMICEPTAAT